MDSKISQWIRIKTEMDRLSLRKKELAEELFVIEQRLATKYMVSGEKVTREGYDFQVVEKKVNERRIPKKEKIAMMAGSLQKILKHPPSDSSEAIKDILESGKPPKMSVNRLVVKKEKKPKKD